MHEEILTIITNTKGESLVAFTCILYMLVRVISILFTFYH